MTWPPKYTNKKHRKHLSFHQRPRLAWMFSVINRTQAANWFHGICKFIHTYIYIAEPCLGICEFIQAYIYHPLLKKWGIFQCHVSFQGCISQFLFLLAPKTSLLTVAGPAWYLVNFLGESNLYGKSCIPFEQWPVGVPLLGGWAPRT